MTPAERATAVQARVIADAWLEGSRIYWERRAATLEAARPRRGDFNGRATPAEIVERYQRLTAAAAACRARATGADGVALVDLVDTMTAVAAGAAA